MVNPGGTFSFPYNSICSDATKKLSRITQYLINAPAVAHPDNVYLVMAMKSENKLFIKYI